MPRDEWDNHLLVQHVAFAISLALTDAAVYACDRWLLHGSWLESVILMATVTVVAIFTYTAPIFKH